MPIHFTDVDIKKRRADGTIIMIFSVPADRSGESQTVAVLTCHPQSAVKLEEGLRGLHGSP